MQRTATIERKTNETDIKLSVDIDGQGQSTISTGVGFLDHMLDLFTRHAMINLEVDAVGDLDVDDHHTVEDTGICLGLAIRQAVGDKAGIRRYGHFTLPMDETLVTAAIDLSGRSYLLHHIEYPTAKVGRFDTELVREFWQAFANSGQLNLHLMLHHGCNSHHISEASFKATARALRQATEVDPRLDGAVPSTKGTLS